MTISAATSSVAASAKTSGASSIRRRLGTRPAWISSPSRRGESSSKNAGTERSRDVFWPAPILAARSGRERGEADVVPAAPVAGGRTEGREAKLAPVGRDADAVDPGATDDRDTPTTLGAGAQKRQRVVSDDDLISPRPLFQRAPKIVLLGREVDPGKEHLGDRNPRVGP